jgi:hypothetical protein
VPGEGPAAALRRPALGQEQRALRRTPAAEPQQQPAERDDPEPAGGHFAVVAAEVAEVQIAVELVQPGTQRERARTAVGGQLAAYLRGVRIDEDGEGLALLHLRGGHQHAGGRPVLVRGPDVGHRAVGAGGAGGFELPADGYGALVAGGRDGQLIGVEDLLGLEGEGVQQPAEGGDEEQRGDQQARVEVEPQYERPQRAPRRS